MSRRKPTRIVPASGAATTPRQPWNTLALSLLRRGVHKDAEQAPGPFRGLIDAASRRYDLIRELAQTQERFGALVALGVPDEAKLTVKHAGRVLAFIHEIDELWPGHGHAGSGDYFPSAKDYMEKIIKADAERELAQAVMRRIEESVEIEDIEQTSLNKESLQEDELTPNDVLEKLREEYEGATT